MKKAHYVIDKNDKGFFFTSVAANGECVGGGINQYYPTKPACKRGIMDNHIHALCANTEMIADQVKVFQSPEYQKTIKLRIVDKTQGK